VQVLLRQIAIGGKLAAHPDLPPGELVRRGPQLLCDLAELFELINAHMDHLTGDLIPKTRKDPLLQSAGTALPIPLEIIPIQALSICKSVHRDLRLTPVA
jgi:hypothetical protein